MWRYISVFLVLVLGLCNFLHANTRPYLLDRGMLLPISFDLSRLHISSTAIFQTPSDISFANGHTVVVDHVDLFDDIKQYSAMYSWSSPQGVSFGFGASVSLVNDILLVSSDSSIEGAFSQSTYKGAAVVGMPVFNDVHLAGRMVGVFSNLHNSNSTFFSIDVGVTKYLWNDFISIGAYLTNILNTDMHWNDLLQDTVGRVGVLDVKVLYKDTHVKFIVNSIGEYRIGVSQKIYHTLGFLSDIVFTGKGAERYGYGIQLDIHQFSIQFLYLDHVYAQFKDRTLFGVSTRF